jgi:DNA-binding transcriptional LysR family regulator
MLTLKQIETFYWTGKLGTVQRAANRLHITQSAATKRLQEVERLSSAPLFEGDAGRKATLTPKGIELHAWCQSLLEEVSDLQAMAKDKPSPTHTLRIGLTELIALTWFTSFMPTMRELYPELTIAPEVHSSVILHNHVLANKLDLCFMPRSDISPLLANIEIGRARFEWMGPSGCFRDDQEITAKDLAQWPILEQGSNSIITTLSTHTFRRSGFDPGRFNGGDNVMALGGLVEAGAGLACLPLDLFTLPLQQGRMQLLNVMPPVQRVQYCAVFHKQPRLAIHQEIVRVAQQCCKFS